MFGRSRGEGVARARAASAQGRESGEGGPGSGWPGGPPGLAIAAAREISRREIWGAGVRGGRLGKPMATFSPVGERQSADVTARERAMPSRLVALAFAVRGLKGDDLE